jgi:hypothetical protein
VLRGKLPPSSHRSHPLPSGGCCQENLHRRPIVATRCQAVDVARKISTVWRTVATGKRCDGRTAPIVATRCQAVEVARKISTVWRTVATGERWLRENGTHRSHPLPSGGCCEENLHRLANGGYGQAVRRANCTHRSHPLPSGGCCEENLHRLANGGYGQAVDVARKISTVWRTVATGARWLRENGATGERHPS